MHLHAASRLAAGGCAALRPLLAARPALASAPRPAAAAPLRRRLSGGQPPAALPAAAVTASYMQQVAAAAGVPPIAIAAGAFIAVALIGLGVAQVTGRLDPAGAAAAGGSSAAAAAAPLPRKDAVLVLGARGRLGRRVVQRLLAAGRTVVAGVRDEARALADFEAMGVTAGRQGAGAGILFLQGGVDVTDAATLGAALFEGVTQVVSALGPVVGSLPGGAARPPPPRAACRRSLRARPFCRRRCGRRLLTRLPPPSSKPTHRRLRHPGQHELGARGGAGAGQRGGRRQDPPGEAGDDRERGSQHADRGRHGQVGPPG